jgi:acetyl/propionyl-CoA carboxylase alpha subunit
VIEETPSSVLTEELRQQMGEAAVKVMRAAGYSNAGTVEFLVDENQHFYFLEVNTRLQVEHPVTELVCGLDLVAEQIRLAEALPLQFSQKQVRRLGHALECRIYAEDPSNNFFPSTGTLYRYRPPQGPFVRVDNGFQQGDSVPIYYDPLLAKVITWGNNRAHSIATMRRALSEFVVEGVRTTIPFCEYVLRTEQFRSGSFNTNFVQNYFQPEYLYLADEWNLTAAAVSAALVAERTMALTPQPSVVRSNNGRNFVEITFGHEL